MMKIPTWVLPAPLFLLAVTLQPLMGQTSGGSTYSILNLGDIRAGVTAASTGHAGIETAVPSPYAINSVNPALWSDLRYVLVQATLGFDQYNVSNSTSSQYQNMMKLQDFSIGFPYSERYGGTLVFSIRPYSTVNFRTTSTQVITTPDSISNTATVVYSGEGGLSEIVFGSSFRPFAGLTIGVAGLRYFGSITDKSQIQFASSGLNPSTYSTSDLYNGFGAQVGIVTELFDRQLRIAATGQPGASLKRDRRLISQFVDGGFLYTDTTAHTQSTISIPASLGLGLSYRTGRFLFLGETRMQSWDNNEYPNSRNSNRVALGLDRLPAESMNASGLDRWAFRFGAYLDRTYYQVGGRGIDQIGASFGFGFPLTASNPLNSSTAIDVSLELGKRGTNDNSMTQETFAKLTLGLSLNELWFQRSRR